MILRVMPQLLNHIANRIVFNGGHGFFLTGIEIYVSYFWTYVKMFSIYPELSTILNADFKLFEEGKQHGAFMNDNLINAVILKRQNESDEAMLTFFKIYVQSLEKYYGTDIFEKKN